MRAPRVRIATKRVPAWVERLAMPVWVSSADGIITYLNAHAEILTGRSRSACLGRPCHLVISGRMLDGSPLCAPMCPPRRLAANGEAIAPIPMKIDTDPGEQREVTVMIINVGAGQLVHCVVDGVHHARLQEFIGSIVHHATGTRREAQRARCNTLTARERDVLRLLARDMTQQEIATQLAVSYTTVRNHVQHIIAKLGVHSILEAVALWLTDDG